MTRLGRLEKDSFLIILPGLFVALAIGLPLTLVISRSMGTGSEVSKVFTSPYYRSIFAFTVWQALISTFFSLLFGLPGAYFVGRCEFPGRLLLKSFSTVPFVMPPILVVLGFVLIFGNGGVINHVRQLLLGGEVSPWTILYSLPAIIMAHVFYNSPLTMRIVGNAWNALPLSEKRAAMSLGASRFRIFFLVDLPHLIPDIATAGILTFLYCFMSFSIVLVLGGGPELTTIEIEIYRLIKHQLNFARGSVLAAMESLYAFFMLCIYAIIDFRYRSRTRDAIQNFSRRPHVKLTGVGKWFAIAYFLTVMILIVGPLISIIINSFITKATRTSPAAFSLMHWIRLLNADGSISLKAVLRTVLLASCVSITSTLTASSLGWYSVRHLHWRRIIETVMALPLGVSSIILGLGWLLFLQIIPPANGIRLISLITAHSLIVLPFCYRIIAGRLKQISTRVPQAARISGANALQSLFHIELPMTRNALITCGVFSFALSAGELNSTIILAPGDFTTIPLAIYRLIGAYDIHRACVLGTILITICTIAFFFFDQYEEF